MTSRLFSIFIALLLGAVSASAVPVIDSVVAMTSTCQNNGAITIYAHNSQPLTYAITSGPVTMPGQAGNSFSALPSGVYKIQVSDAAGDTISSSVTIGGNYVAPDVHPRVVFPTCQKTYDFLLIGNLTPGTGKGPFTWQTVSPSPVILPPQSSDTFHVTAAATYTVRCTDACGNVVNKSFTFHDNGGTNIIAGSITENLISCDSVHVDVTVHINGDSNNLSFPYKLILSNHQGASNSFTQTAPVVNSTVTNGTTSFYATATNVTMSRSLPRGPWETIFATIIDGCGDTITQMVSMGADDTITHPVLWTTYSTGGCHVTTSNVFHYIMSKPNNWIVVNDSTHAVAASGINPAGSPGGASLNDITIVGLGQDTSFTMMAIDACQDTIYTSFVWPEPAIGPMRFVGPDQTACLDSTGGEVMQFWGFTSGVKIEILSGPSGAHSTKPGYAYTEHYTYPKVYHEPSSEGTLHLANVSPGIYVYRISDSCGHSMTDSFAMFQAFTISLSRSFSYVRGCNDSNTINFKFRRPFGGNDLPDVFYQVRDITTGSLLYTHNFGDTIAIESILYAPPGTYVLSAQYTDSGSNFTDGQICSQISDTLIVQPYLNPVLSSLSSIGCGGTWTISAHMDSTTGSFPYSYQIISGPQTSALQASSQFTVQHYGVYTILAYDACGNTTTNTINIDSLAGAPTHIYMRTDSCFRVTVAGNIYSTNTILTDTLRNTLGCDSVIHIDSVFVRGGGDSLPLLGMAADTFCSTRGGVISAAHTYPSYLWSTGSIASSIPVSVAGAYALTVTDVQGCQLADTMMAAFVDSPFITAGWTTEATVCTDDPLIVHLSVNDPLAHYVWADAPQYTLDRTVSDSGIYIFTISNQCAATTYTLTASGKICDENLYVPSAFSPNGDGINDIFQIYSSYNVKMLDLQVFNRWGEKVYEGDNEATGWDGKYKDLNAPTGVYVYEMTAVWLTGHTFTRRGSVTLIR